MKYLHPYGRGNLANLDSMRYKYDSFAPASGGDTWFRTHVDLVSTTRPTFNDSWVTLSQSGTTTKMMATQGSELYYAPPETITPVSREVHSGAVVLVNPGPHRGQFVISIPRNDELSVLTSPVRRKDPSEESL
jgi:hypothetical protein